ncbi:6-hydroxymethylpterin diphosphokinase MptE-like protein [Arsukibacterium sp.]|uniref:6-hydroxymethylpterin diphosphokinase MptE-like protein n=1 Tax=Arsukibacterium sp. TaxID=1977258 RepID=UPI001BD416C1|nr:6-hydroxymethylpterin diphosphokinase MptE-like protein [Arsukibacterium sp.]
MSKVYTDTVEAIDNWLLPLSANFAKSTIIAIFGAGPYARHLVARLKMQGFSRLYFLLSQPRTSQLDGYPVISSSQLSAYGIEVILAGSMAEPVAQQQALNSMGITVPFYYLEGGHLLCSEPRSNPCNAAQLSALKDKHKGQTFFIIGNGPSLNQTPPEHIQNAICMAGNGILLRPNFIPDYYFLLEERALNHWQERIRALNVPKMLASHLHFQHGDADNLTYFPACFQSDSDTVDPYQYGIPSGGTIISSMMYFAVYMGAKQVVIIGVDNNYRGAQQQTHFAPGYYTEQRQPMAEEKALILAERQKQGILRAARMAEVNNVAVYDATPVQNNLGINKIDFSQFSVAH